MMLFHPKQAATKIAAQAARKDIFYALKRIDRRRVCFFSVFIAVSGLAYRKGHGVVHVEDDFQFGRVGVFLD